MSVTFFYVNGAENPRTETYTETIEQCPTAFPVELIYFSALNNGINTVEVRYVQPSQPGTVNVYNAAGALVVNVDVNVGVQVAIPLGSGEVYLVDFRGQNLQGVRKKFKA